MTATTFFRRVVGLLCLPIAAGYAYEPEIKTVQLFVEGEESGLVFLYPTAEGTMISESDVPVKYFDGEAFEALRRYDAYDCAPCVRIEDFGTYREDTTAGEGHVSVRPSMMPVRTIDLIQTAPLSTDRLSRGFNVQGNLAISGRDAEVQEGQSYVGFGNVSVSLGSLGVLHSGYRKLYNADGTDEGFRLATYLENHFVDQQITYRIGDVSMQTDRNDPSLGITGIQVMRNFQTRPDKISSPLYDFYAELERPAVIDLYLGSQKIRSREYDSPGPVRLTDYRPSTSGKVLLVVTDALGSQRVVETDFFANGNLLGRGVLDFGASAGTLRGDANETLSDTLAGGLTARYGITNQVTLGGSYSEVREDEGYQSRNFGVEASIGSFLGSLDLTSRISWNNETGERGHSHRVSWSYTQTFANRLRLSMGAAGFKEDGYATHFGAPRNLDGGRAYVGVVDRKVALGGNYSDIGDIRSYGAVFSYAPSRGFSYSVSYQEVFDKGALSKDRMVSVGVNYRFQRTSSPVSSVRASARRSLNTDTNVHQMNASGTAMDHRVSWHLKGVNTDLASEDSQFEAYDATISANAEAVAGSYQYRRGVNAFEEHIVDLSTGFALGPKASLVFSNYINSSTGIAVLDLGAPDIAVSAGGYEATSSWRGLVAVPITGFRETYASIDESTLPQGAIPREPFLNMSVYPGQSAFATLKLASPGVFIKVPAASVGDTVVINGIPYPYYRTGVFTEDVSLGRNTIEHDDATYILDLKQIDLSFPTYEVN